ncbi:MAG: alpha amylase C-terminal domain-containing protein, partial [Actinomycetaceae bacterium]|nr:alpha amylase C-terminal domain-containing protein [Actinomycetaceae bacterium]
LVYAFSEQFLLPLSHDEVVHGKGSLYQKMPGDAWQKLAGVRELLAYQWSHPGKKLLFMGQEFAQIEEWNESRGLDWWLTDDPAHDGVLSLVKRLNEVYREHSALWEEDFSPAGFEWIIADDADSNVIAYLRKNSDGSDVVAVVCNFSGIPRIDYRLGLPRSGRWREVVNTDAIEYGGSGVGNLGAVRAEDIPWHGRPYSSLVQLPPFGVLYLVPSDDDEADETENVVVANAPIPPVIAAESASKEAAEPVAAPVALESNDAEEGIVDTNEIDDNEPEWELYMLGASAQESEQARREILEGIDGLDVDNPLLGMPGVLPPENADREPLSDYAIVEYDYSSVPQAAPSASAEPVVEGITLEDAQAFVAELLAGDLERGGENLAENLGGEAPSGMSEVEVDYSANAAGIYLAPRDWLEGEPLASDSADSAESAGSVDSEQTPASADSIASAQRAKSVDELDEEECVPAAVPSEEPHTLMEAAQNAADQFLTLPLPSLSDIEQAGLFEEEESHNEEPEERQDDVLIGTVVTTLINGAGILPFRNV